MTRQLEFFDSSHDLNGMRQPEGGYRPDPDKVRADLTRWLSELKAASAWPWKRDDILVRTTIFPQMCNWLPDAEAAELRTAFAEQVARLGEPSRKVDPSRFAPFNTEATILSTRTGLRLEACRKWMEHVGLKSVLQLKERYPNAEHAACYQRAAREIEDFICDPPAPTADSAPPACD